MNHVEIKKLTTSSIFCGLSVIFMATGLIPGVLFVSIFVATAILDYILNLYGVKYWFITYIASGLLIFMLIPDLELSLTYIFMAWYPIVKLWLDKKDKKVRRILKAVVFCVASLIIYRVAVFVFGMEAIVVEGIKFYWVIYTLMFMFMFMLLDIYLVIFQKKISNRIDKILNHKV